MKPVTTSLSIALASLYVCAQANALTPNKPSPTPVEPSAPITVRLKATSTITAPAINQIGPAWGANDVQTAASFPAVMLATVEQNTQLNATIQSLPDLELAHLTTELLANDHSGYTSQIIAVMLKQLSAAQIARLASAFGAGPVDAQLHNAPTSVQGAYWAITPETPIVYSVSWYQRNKVAEMPAQPAYDIYLNFRLQSAGVTQLQAINKTHIFYRQQVKGAEIIGVYIGIAVGLYTIAEKIDPSIRQDTIDLAKLAWWNIQQSIPSIPTVVFPSPEMSCPGCGIQSPGDGDPGDAGDTDKPVTDQDWSICDENGNC